MHAQYSCSTTGSSLNELSKVLSEKGIGQDRLRWSVIDRWPTHPGLIKVHTVHRPLTMMMMMMMMMMICLQAFADNVRTALGKFPAQDQSKVVLLFSAHSLPLKV